MSAEGDVRDLRWVCYASVVLSCLALGLALSVVCSAVVPSVCPHSFAIVAYPS